MTSNLRSTVGHPLAELIRLGAQVNPRHLGARAKPQPNSGETRGALEAQPASRVNPAQLWPPGPLSSLPSAGEKAKSGARCPAKGKDSVPSPRLVNEAAFVILTTLLSRMLQAWSFHTEI